MLGKRALLLLLTELEILDSEKKMVTQAKQSCASRELRLLECSLAQPL
jgi:hypothetical protein